ncbi:DNA cytosine methyltransferase [Bradyrhizobium diazoefficiens]|uniref:DNA (cytosine-5-)-methyltransferase n=1 Tax=Bradyrhizobium diazoefficiens TaxID=1355477 RepID=A0A810B3B7_9BRAD|nr:cytosine-specific methyltransferase [Bradyrhizobium diazoefficiens]
MTDTLKVFDFFSGAGGTSQGLVDAGMEVVFGLDFDRDSSKTFMQNIRPRMFVEDDIQRLSVEFLKPLFEGLTGPIVFSGCAPCQPFSKQNRSSRAGDPRRNLLGEFARFVERWKPDFVVVENVPGLQRVRAPNGPLERFKRTLTRAGYSHVVDVLPALWFGVPQVRERLILIASKRGIPTLPTPTHGEGLLPFVSVSDAIGELPPLAAGEVDPDDSDHQAAHLSPINLDRIRATPAGAGRESWPKKLWLDCHRDHRGHSDVYGRLSWDRPAASLTTRCISLSNGRFGHPEQHRAISAREAACLQTFPKTYRFFGSLESRARQIGNAVPPKMAQAIGHSILRQALGS